MITEKNYLSRIEKLRKSMKEKNVDSVFISSYENRRYYSGFTGSNGWLVITGNSLNIFTDGRYIEQVKHEAPLYTLVVSDQSYQKAMLEAFSSFASSHPLGKKIGFEMGMMSVSLYSELLGRVNNSEFVAFGEEIRSPRDYKDPVEIEMIRRAVKIAEEGFQAIEAKFISGATERELAAELQYRMKLAGADNESFDTIVGSGENGAMPHAKVSDRVLKEGDAIVVDWGAIADGYNSDMTRTLFVGKPEGKMKEVYEIVLEAQMKVLKNLKPGMKTGEADAIARDHIKAAGYGKEFGHGLGHGVGLAVHEMPSLKEGMETVLQPGMVVTVEPGIYLPGIGGVRIEDLVVITEDGCEVLTSLPKELKS